MKSWELENLDFSIPWFYTYDPDPIKFKDYIFNTIYGIYENNTKYKQNYIKFYGYYKLMKGLSDFYYIPDSSMSEFIELADKMNERRVFLEYAIPAIFGLLSAPKYHAINQRGLWGQDRYRTFEILHKEFQQIFIHPIKFSYSTNKEKVNKYNYFVNALYF